MRKSASSHCRTRCLFAPALMLINRPSGSDKGSDRIFCVAGGRRAGDASDATVQFIRTAPSRRRPSPPGMPSRKLPLDEKVQESLKKPVEYDDLKKNSKYKPGGGGLRKLCCVMALSEFTCNQCQFGVERASLSLPPLLSLLSPLQVTTPF